MIIALFNSNNSYFSHRKWSSANISSFVYRDFHFSLWPTTFSFGPLSELSWQVKPQQHEGEETIWGRGKKANHSGGRWDRKLHAWPDKFCLQATGVRVTAIVWILWTFGWGRIEGVYLCGLYSCTRHTMQSPRPSTGVTVQEISTDVGLRPQLSRWSGRDGVGGVKWVGEQEEH